MKHKEAFTRLTTTFADTHRKMQLVEKEFENVVDALRIEIGDEHWDVHFKAAVFLAMKDAEAKMRGETLISED
jgi:hypothetical protein